MGSDTAQADAMREVDAGPQDLAVPDAGASAYVTAGIFVNNPPPRHCIEDPYAFSEDLPGDFVPMPFGHLGRLHSIHDWNDDGRSELYVWDGDFPAIPESHGPFRRVGIYEWDGDDFRLQGHIRGAQPFNFFDFDGDGTKEMFAMTLLLEYSERQASHSVRRCMAIRRHDPASDWYFDVPVVDYLEETWPGSGELVCPMGQFGASLAADLDGDGRGELIIGERNMVWEQTSPGVFAPYFEGAPDPDFDFPYSGLGNGDTTIGDFDGDGRTEVVLTTTGPMVVSNPEVSPEGTADVHARVLEVQGDNRLVDTMRVGTGGRSLQSALAGDVTGDGVDDLVLGSGSICHRLQLWTTAGDNRLRSPWYADFPISNAGVARGAAALADIDGDGDKELVADIDNVLTVWDWRSDAASTAGGRMVQVFGQRLCEAAQICGNYHVAAADLNGDGRAEIVGLDPSGGDLSGRLPAGQDELWNNPRGVLIWSPTGP